ncbi:arginase family protein [Phenylobacterium sp.]|jgi:arginase family enzyme|uniref:arginase family protein n=1 Tax=Phenylobacterium sp. TaxID=1871053 RepID=UPI002F41B215
MRAALLHLDTALIGQDALAGRVAAAGGRAVEARDLGPALRLWSRPKAIDGLRARLREALPAADGAALVMTGSGDFHHVSPLLLERALEASDAPAVTVLHFDNHPDWVRFENGVHCGSWVGWAARMPKVAKVITVGVCSRDIQGPSPRRADLELISGDRLELYAYRAPDGADAVRLCGREWPTIEAVGEDAFASLLAGRIGTDAVYVTIDKDVLRSSDAATNWDQGRTSLSFLKRLIAVLANHRLIGADVVGDWSPAVYGGGPIATLMKQGEALLDQPWSKPAPTARAANENVNLELLQVLAPASRGGAS